MENVPKSRGPLSYVASDHGSAPVPAATPLAAHRFTLLPQELFEHTIDLLRDEHSSLYSCSLVSRRWLPASSRHLLSCLRWPPCAHHWNLGSNQCKCHLFSDEDTLRSLHELCESSPRMRENVRGLRIQLSWWKRIAPIGPVSKTTTPEELGALFDLLPRLQSLEILSLLFADRAPRVPPNIPRGPMKSVKLEFAVEYQFSPETDHYQHAIDIVLQFSHISTLSVEAANVSLPHPPTSPRRIRADTLELVCRGDGTTGPTMLQALTQTTDLTGVHTLTLSEPDVAAPGQPPCPITSSALRGCTQLRTLTCSGNMLNRLLQHPAPVPTLHELRVEVTRTGDAPLGALWADAAALARCPLASHVHALGVRVVYRDRAPTRASTATVDARVRADVKVVDWPALSRALAALPALRVLDVAVDVRLFAPRWTRGVGPGPLRDERRRTLEALRVCVEDAVRAALPHERDRTTRIAVSMDPVL